MLCALCPFGAAQQAPGRPAVSLGTAVTSVAVTSSSEVGGPPSPGRAAPGRARRRDRHGRGLRGRLVPPSVPLYRSRAQQFDDLVLEAVARLEPRWETELSDVEFAVQEVPDADFLAEGDASGGVPLARVVRSGGPETSETSRPATGSRIVLFRRPLLARAEDEEELSELVFDVIVEEFAEILGVDPETVDPGYGDASFGD